MLHHHQESASTQSLLLSWPAFATHGVSFKRSLIETLLSGLSTSEKLDAMDILWRDLSYTAASYVSPDWHGSVLAERLANPSTGSRLPLADSIRDVKERLDARRS